MAHPSAEESASPGCVATSGPAVLTETQSPVCVVGGGDGMIDVEKVEDGSVEPAEIPGSLQQVFVHSASPGVELGSG